ncbi:TPA: hypothetical protein EYN98_07115 [Candidatus Poribacteria bacterium]|nr:hypothetical protein [Flavobacteriales bacterium]HIA65820.1 hypothetical protein [Candidatus Poribacteria bacterium]
MTKCNDCGFIVGQCKCDNDEYRIEELQAENEKLKKRWEDLKDCIDHEEEQRKNGYIFPAEIRSWEHLIIIANKKWEDLSAYIIGDNELYDDLDYDLIIEKMKDLEDKEHYKNT